MSASTVRTTPAELHTERFWCEQIDPVARAHGMEPPTELHQDPGDRHCHLLKGSDGTLILVVRTDSEPNCCSFHDKEPTSARGCFAARR